MAEEIARLSAALGGAHARAARRPDRSAAGAASRPTAGIDARAGRGCGGRAARLTCPAMEYAFRSARRTWPISCAATSRPVRCNHSRRRPRCRSPKPDSRILALAPADRVRMAVAAYAAWSSERWGGPKGGGLAARRVRSPARQAAARRCGRHCARGMRRRAKASPTPAIRRTRPCSARSNATWPRTA